MGKKILVFLGPPIILRRYPVCGWPAFGPVPSPYCCQPFANPAFCCAGANSYGYDLAAAVQAYHPQAQLVNLTLPRNSPLLRVNNNCAAKNTCCRC